MEGFRLLGKDSEWRRGLKTGVGSGSLGSITDPSSLSLDQ